jgi:hypothetical protein
MATRQLKDIAAEIDADWKTARGAAQPYIVAMSKLKTLNDSYGADTALSVVLHFLANAQTWKGPVAQRVKFELKEMQKQNNSN